MEIKLDLPKVFIFWHVTLFSLMTRMWNILKLQVTTHTLLLFLSRDVLQADMVEFSGVHSSIIAVLYHCSTERISIMETCSEQHIMQATYGVSPLWQFKYCHRQKYGVGSMTVANQFQIGQICQKHQVLSVI